MGGKRPDQYAIAPNEGRTTDYKFNPQVTHGQDADQPQLREGDKQRLAASQAGDQPFMPDVPAPSAQANRAARAAQGQLEDGETDEAETDTDTRKENPLA